MGVWMDGWMMVLLLIMDQYCVRVLLLVLLRSLMMILIFIIIIIIIIIIFGCYDLLFDDDISAQDATLMVQDSTHFYLCSGT